MKNIYSILSIIALIALNSCEYPGCIKGNDDVVSETRSVSDFTKLSCEGSYDVFVEYDTAYSLRIVADENLLEYITTDVSGNWLTIGVRNDKCLRSNNLDVYITTPHLENVELVGSGSITCQYFDEDDMDILLSGSGNVSVDAYLEYVNAELSGSGSINLEGQSNYADYILSGSGNINARNMQVNECYAIVEGSGDIRVTVNQYLEAVIEGSGAILYWGNPDVETRIEGSGEIKPKE